MKHCRAAGSSWRSQLWVLALLAASASRLATSAASSPAATPNEHSETGIVLAYPDGRPALRYRAAGVPFKPYVEELRTPAGLNVLLDSPDDHRHHHGLMLALGVDETDFWTEDDPATDGSQVSIAVEQSGTGDAGLTHRLAWQKPDGTRLVDEQRTIRLLHGPTLEVTLLTWQSDLRLAKGRESATFWGAHYYGLGMRLVPEFNGASQFANPDSSPGVVVRGDERLTASRWCSVQGTVGGKPVTVAMFDHPLNPRSPARWFTMSQPFAYLSATLDLQSQPRPLTQATPLSLRWGVAVWDGHVSQDTIEQTCQHWVSREAP